MSAVKRIEARIGVARAGTEQAVVIDLGAGQAILFTASVARTIAMDLLRAADMLEMPENTPAAPAPRPITTPAGRKPAEEPTRCQQKPRSRWTGKRSS